MKLIMLKFIRRFYRFKKLSSQLKLDYQGQEASDLIKQSLISEAPCMISRLGAVELNALTTGLARNFSSLKKIKEFMNYKINHMNWDSDIKYTMSNNAGFFPVTNYYLEKFVERMLEDIREIDILGSWLPGEELLTTYFSKNIQLVRLRDIEPYYHKKPWSISLEKNKVLVIHPFADTIKKQYLKRHLLFVEKDILPDFELITLKSVQSITGEKTDYKTWFDALNSMCQKVNEIEFDIAIIGAGAYGLPIAAHIKRSGKKAIHLGGATQILFGIKGRRWEQHPVIKKFFNEYWVRPLPNEIPKKFRNVENGCYW